MTSSRNGSPSAAPTAASDLDELPPALSSMSRARQPGHQHDPALPAAALALALLPALALLAAFALPTVVTSTWRPGVERAAQERGAQSDRLARHLFLTATTAAPGKEVRVTGIGPRLMHDRRQAWENWYREVSVARW